MSIPLQVPYRMQPFDQIILRKAHARYKYFQLYASQRFCGKRDRELRYRCLPKGKSLTEHLGMPKIGNCVFKCVLECLGGVGARLRCLVNHLGRPAGRTTRIIE